MGSGVSLQRNKRIYLETAGGNVSTVAFSSQCNTQELKELIADAANLNRWAAFRLKDQQGCIVSVSPSIAVNTQSTPYLLECLPDSSASPSAPLVNEALSKVSEEFSKVFKIEEFKQDLSARFDALEKRLEEASSKVAEIESCKEELADLRNQISPSVNGLHKKDRTIEAASPRLPQAKYPKMTLSKQAIDSLKKPTFDIWNWKPDEMICLMEQMFYELDLVSALSIDPSTLQQWLLAVQHKYRNNPFHNFRHSFCVTQMMYGMIHLLELKSVFTKLELATLIISCVCHDIDHPGFNNNYQINARTELAIRYNDISPLENHHCAVTFEVLSNPSYNIFSHVSKEDYKKLRAGIIELILATDMARHSEIMESFKKIQTCLDYKNDEHRRVLKLVLIKCSDISNEIRPTEIAEPWVDCLLEEYFRQSDLEKSSGLPVAPFMDRDKVTKPSAQIGFIKFVLIPMFETMAKVFPQLVDPVLKPLKSSLEHYEHLKLLDEAKSQK